DDITNIAGNPDSYSITLYDKSIATSYCSSIGIVAGQEYQLTVTRGGIENAEAVFLIYAGVIGSTEGNTNQFDRLMLVKGNKIPTTWTPAPEDKLDAPTTAGTTGQVLTKTESGTGWSDVPNAVGRKYIELKGHTDTAIDDSLYIEDNSTVKVMAQTGYLSVFVNQLKTDGATAELIMPAGVRLDGIDVNSMYPSNATKVSRMIGIAHVDTIDEGEYRIYTFLKAGDTVFVKRTVYN
ncbi:MAG: hypothetical protein J1E33_06610, partial [Alistipes sp.]|nr:hypothetical protein [Alistipes sp.]